MSQQYHTEFLIIGGGIAGLSLAVGLTQRKRDFLILEQSPLIQGIGAGIGITSNAISAFAQINMDTKVKSIANPLQSLQIVYQNGKSIIDGNPRLIKGYDLTNYALHRSDLHQCLLNEISSERIFTNANCTQITQAKEGYTVQCTDGSTFHCKALIGADGLHSTVRNFLFPKSKIRYAGFTCWRAIVKFEDNHPATSIETWGAKGRFGITPLRNGEIYWYACINSKTTRNPLYSQYGIQDLQNNFLSYHAIIPAALAASNSATVIQNDIADLQPLQQYHLDKAVLIGDAAHATTPNLGQGACMGIEDAAVLLQIIDATDDYADAFVQFSRRRVARCRYLVSTARTMGKIAQLNNSAILPLRNFIIKNVPSFIQRQQIKKILNTQTVL